jgi:hypothetical protein
VVGARSLRREELLPVGYFHLVFTLPGELHDLLAYNAGLLYGELFSQGWQSLEQLCRDGRYLGARPGMLFRGKFVSALRRHYKAGALRLSGLCRKYLDKRQFDRLLHLVMSKEWVVYAKEPFAGPEHLFGYLGRYSHRVAISNHRIVSVNETRVQFRYRDYADGNKEKVTALSPQEFIRRFLQHILPDGFCKIRYYGILSNRHRRQSVQICRKALGVAPPPPKPRLTWQERLYRATGTDVSVCPCCQSGWMLTVETLPLEESFFAGPGKCLHCYWSLKRD